MKPKRVEHPAGPGAIRREKRVQRQERLIKAAIDVIAAKGIRGASVDLIARQAGVSHGMVSFDFSSKDKLMLSVLDRLATRQLDILTRALKDKKDPADRLRSLFEAEFSRANFSRKQGAVWQDFWNEARSNPQVQKVCAAYGKHYLALLEPVLHDLAEKHGLADFPIEEAKRTLQGLTDGLWENYVTFNRLDRKSAIATCLQVSRWMFPMEKGFEPALPE